jgi:hypothetical protein
MYSRRFKIKGRSHKICFRGFLGEKRKVSCLMLNGSVVQWFSGMLFCCAGSALYIQNSLVLLKTGGGINRDEEGRNGKVWFGNRSKRREGVTRLIKLFYQSKLQNLQVQNFIFNKIFLKQIKLCT